MSSLVWFTWVDLRWDLVIRIYKLTKKKKTCHLWSGDLLALVSIWPELLLELSYQININSKCNQDISVNIFLFVYCIYTPYQLFFTHLFSGPIDSLLGVLGSTLGQVVRMGLNELDHYYHKTFIIHCYVFSFLTNSLKATSRCWLGDINLIILHLII